MWWLSTSFQNQGHKSAAITASTPLRRLFTRVQNLAGRICSHSATRALVSSNTDVGVIRPGSQSALQFIPKVLDGKMISLWSWLWAQELLVLKQERAKPRLLPQRWKQTVVSLSFSSLSFAPTPHTDMPLCSLPVCLPLLSIRRLCSRTTQGPGLCGFTKQGESHAFLFTRTPTMKQKIVERANGKGRDMKKRLFIIILKILRSNVCLYIYIFSYLFLSSTCTSYILYSIQLGPGNPQWKVAPYHQSKKSNLCLV